ncbi:hypothetical protein Gotur_018642 [Gossypium turneri]
MYEAEIHFLLPKRKLKSNTYWKEVNEAIGKLKAAHWKKQQLVLKFDQRTVYEEQDGDLCKVILISGKGLNPYDPYVLKVMSGTSMANAVVVGMLSYIKTFHKDWGIARIKSAIMTSGN